jgi:hypothetical protein
VRQLLAGFLDPQRGVLAASLDDLRRKLADPATASSIPHAVAELVEKRVKAVHADLAKALDLTDPASGLAAFLRQLRADAEGGRREQAAATAKMASHLEVRSAEIRSALVAQGLVAQAVDAEAQGTRKGLAFEDAVAAALQRFGAAFGDGVELVGAVAPGGAGSGSNAKIGDVLVTLHEPSLGSNGHTGPASKGNGGKGHGKGKGKDGNGDAGGDAGHSTPLRIAIEVKAGAFAMAGAKGLPKQVFDAVELREARGGLGVVRPEFLGKRQGWYTPLPGGQARGALVAFDEAEPTGAGEVALEVAYRVLRAQVVADAQRAKQEQQLGTSGGGPGGHGAQRLDPDVLLAKAAACVASCDRLRRMKRNATDAASALSGLRHDLDELERDLRRGLKDLEVAIRP